MRRKKIIQNNKLVLSKSKFATLTFQANLEVIFPPEIQGMGEFKAGPGDVARCRQR
jgi:hypothetical protein